MLLITIHHQIHFNRWNFFISFLFVDDVRSVSFGVNDSFNGTINSSGFQYEYWPDSTINLNAITTTSTATIPWTSTRLGRSIEWYSKSKSIQVHIKSTLSYLVNLYETNLRTNSELDSIVRIYVTINNYNSSFMKIVFHGRKLIYWSQLAVLNDFPFVNSSRIEICWDRK